MAAKKHNVVVEQGATFQLVVDVKNQDGTSKNLTGYSARMQIRPTKSSSTIIADLITPVSSGIDINNPTGGQLTVTIAASVTATYTWEYAFYDLEIVLGSVVNRVIEGNVTLNKEVTR